MDNEVKNVTIKVTSPRGHDTLELEPSAAIAKLQELSKSGKWTYFDGVIVDANEITVDQLIQAETVLVANDLQGG
jgi:hypothetical protein